MPVSLAPAAQWSLVIIAIFNVLLFAGLVAFVIVGVAEFKKLRAQVQPVIDRVNPILEEVKPVVAGINPMIDHNIKPILGEVQDITQKVSGMVSDISQHAHEIAETGEHTVKEITHRVEATGQVVTDTVSRPVISAAGFIAGLSRALSVLKSYQSGPAHETRRDHARANGDGVTASAMDSR